MEAGQECERCVRHIQTFQLILDSKKGVRIDPLERVARQAQPEEVGNAAEGLVVDDADVVVGQVQHDQRLDLVELRIGDGRDAVAGQIQMLEAALNRIERLDRDLDETVVRSFQDLESRSLEELFRKAFQKVPGQVDDSQLLVVVEQHRAESGQLISLEVNRLELRRRDEAAGLEEGE